MHARNADHARGILKKLQTERREWINRGETEEAVDAYYGPKIEAAQKELARHESRGDDFEDQELFGLAPRRKNSKGNHRRKNAFR